MLIPCDGLAQGAQQPGLPDARLAADKDKLPTTGPRRAPQAKQTRDLGLPADHRCLGASAQGRKAILVCALAGHSEDAPRRVEALEGVLAEVAELEQPAQ